MYAQQTMETGHEADPLSGLAGFGPGVQLMTTDGELPVEWLATGDRLITRDHGAQPVLWIGRVRVRSGRLAHAPELRPVEIAEGALAPGFPTHPTLLAPRSRVLLSGWEVALNAGTEEALAEIGMLSDGSRVVQRPAAEELHYHYLILPMHALVQANGMWAETLLLDDAARDVLGADLPPALAAAPEIAAGHARAARLCLTRWEIAAMRGARPVEALPELIRRVA